MAVDEGGLRQVLGEIVQFARTNLSALSDATKSKLTQFLSLASDKLEQVKGRVTTPIPDTARLLWVMAGGNETAFSKFIRQYPSPDLQRYLNSPNNFIQLVERLSQEIPKGVPGSSDGIPQAWLPSSNVYGFSYDPRSKKLKVKFHEGGVYEYDDVPQGIYDMFRNGAVPAKTSGSNSHGSWFKNKMPSLGAAMHELIKKGGYQYRKLQ